MPLAGDATYELHAEVRDRASNADDGGVPPGAEGRRDEEQSGRASS